MKKYLVKQVYCENNQFYYDTLIDDIKNEYKQDIFIGFNSDYKNINFDLIERIQNELINFSDYDIQVYYKNNLANYIIDTLKHYKHISLKQALKIANIIKNYSGYDKKVYCDILSIIYCKCFKYSVLRGCCQNDWIYCFYSSDIEYTYIQYIEAVFFNEGIEIKISDDKIDTDAINNINDFEYEGYFDYIVDYFLDSDILKTISNIIGCNSGEIVFYKIESVTTKTINIINYKKA